MMAEFAYFLDAWRYCRDHNIDVSAIQRRDWKTWIVSTDVRIERWVRA